jgi:hypothetical protein
MNIGEDILDRINAISDSINNDINTDIKNVKHHPDKFVNSLVTVKRANYSFDVHLQKKIQFNGGIGYEGKIIHTTDSCPFSINQDYSISDAEVKHYTTRKFK